MNNQNSKPVGLGIRELRANLIKVMKESHLDPAICVLVLKDLATNLAEAEEAYFHQYIQQAKQEDEKSDRDDN